MSKKTAFYHGIPIEYNLTRKHVKNLNLRINEYGEIFVSARKDVSVEYINNFVESKAEWIIRNLAQVERYNKVKPDNEVYNGKKVYFLGKPYVIEVYKSEYEKVILEGKVIKIYTSEYESDQNLKEIYLKWLFESSKIIFEDALRKIYEVVKDENIPYPEFLIKNMKSRWGSCRPSLKNITLNLQLIKTDIECIEQVVMHELLHFKQANHSRSFYCLMDKYMPDWRERKHRLDKLYKDGI